MITWVHIAGLLLTLVLIFGISYFSGKKVKNVRDFDSAGGKAGAGIVAGALMGTLVGGSSTVGTAQLAYQYGLSAWWFTLGGGIACLILAVFFARPLRKSGETTLVGIISAEYGKGAGIAASVLSSIGTFINILSQLIAATAVLLIVFPKLSMTSTLIISAVLMMIYVIFGGVLGAGMVGVVKTILLVLASFAGGAFVLSECGGLSLLLSELDHHQYFNLFARGFGTDGGACLSLILGVLSTQSYAQALISGKTDRDAINGALISAVLIPLIGAGGILIGEYMKITEPGLASAKLAFPQFILQHMPPFLAGVFFAALFIAVIGTGAGLSLGISTVVNRDIVKRLTKKMDDPVKSLRFSRILIVLILGAACLLCLCPIGDTILNFAFMSMGLRGAVIFAPLCCALFAGGKIRSGYIMASIIVSPLIVLVFQLLSVLPFDPLFLGVGVSLVICLLGRKKDLTV